MGCPVYKQCITWIKEGTYGQDVLNINNKITQLKEGTYGWDVLSTNDESRG